MCACARSLLGSLPTEARHTRGTVLDTARIGVSPMAAYSPIVPDKIIFRVVRDSLQMET